MSFTGHVIYPTWPRIVIARAFTILTVLIALLEFDKINGLHGDQYRNVVKLIVIISHNNKDHLISGIYHCLSGNIL